MLCVNRKKEKTAPSIILTQWLHGIEIRVSALRDFAFELAPVQTRGGRANATHVQTQTGITLQKEFMVKAPDITSGADP